jgi:hypothetical protein
MNWLDASRETIADALDDGGLQEVGFD